MHEIVLRGGITPFLRSSQSEILQHKELLYLFHSPLLCPACHQWPSSPLRQGGSLSALFPCALQAVLRGLALRAPCHMALPQSS